MREILFRGKNAKTKEWNYGGYTTDPFARSLIIDKDMGCYKIVIPETVGQYTGLTDKNGEKIFEGDIFTYKEEYAKIEYDDDSAMFIIQFDDWYMDFDFLHGHEVEILGNIHDNPELLEV